MCVLFLLIHCSVGSVACSENSNPDFIDIKISIVVVEISYYERNPIAFSPI